MKDKMCKTYRENFHATVIAVKTVRVWGDEEGKVLCGQLKKEEAQVTSAGEEVGVAMGQTFHITL